MATQGAKAQLGRCLEALNDSGEGIDPRQAIELIEAAMATLEADPDTSQFVPQFADIEELAQYIKTARAKGLPERVVLIRHALRNGLLPTITILAFDFGWLIGGIVVIESVFAYPGVGRLLIFSIENHDLPLMQAIILIMATIYALASLTILRMVPVAIAMTGAKLDWETIAFVGWFGPRGIASVLYLLMAAAAIGVEGNERFRQNRGQGPGLLRDRHAAMKEGQAQTDFPVALHLEDEKVLVFAANSSPILDSNFNLRGAMATFNDETALQEANGVLLEMMDKLRKSQDEVNKQNTELKRLATRDPMTNCLNRRSFFERMENADPDLPILRTARSEFAAL